MHALDLTALLRLDGLAGLAIATGLGAVSACVTLAFGWRRRRP